MSRLGAFVQANKVPLGIAGAVVVGGVAFLRSRSASSSGSSTPSYGAGTSPTPSAYSTGGLAASGYDSTQSDVYNALQPALESVAKQNAEVLEALKAQASGAATPIPVPANTPTVSAPSFGTVGGYTGNLYPGIRPGWQPRDATPKAGAPSPGAAASSGSSGAAAAPAATPAQRRAALRAASRTS